MRYANTISILGLALASLSAPALAAGPDAILHSFGVTASDGTSPNGTLLSTGGKLYGVTGGGSPSGFGTVFSVDPTTGAEAVLHTFTGGGDSGYPAGNLVSVNSALYGTASSGGAVDLGTIFSINPSTGAETIVHSFQPTGDGNDPVAGLLNVSGTLYGTTESGGSAGYGAVFSLVASTGAEAVLYSFKAGTDGSSPEASLIDVSGVLYGTTYSGGTSANNYGTLFSVNATTGAETVLYRFKGGADGANPAAALLAVGDVLYGTTTKGGSAGDGTVFSYNTSTAAYKTLYAFKGGSDGAQPQSTLINLSGNLYGTTRFGGASNSGVVFYVNRSTLAETIVDTFSGSTDNGDADQAEAGLIDVNNVLYGTSAYGGTGQSCYPKPNTGPGCGTVFSIAGPAASAATGVAKPSGMLDGLAK